MSGAEVADFVDLTDSPAPEQPAKNPAKANKRSREDTEVIDVVSREDIMSFAAKANQRKRLTSPLSDSTGQVENARQEGPGRPDNLWLKQLHAERTARHGEPNSNDEATADHPDNFPAYSSEAGPSGRGDVSAPAEDCQQRNISLLTWNVWFEEDVALHERMAAIGQTVRDRGYPDVLLFQEMTPRIHQIMTAASWSQHYRTTDPPYNMAYFTSMFYKKDSVTCTRGPSEQMYPTSNMARGLRLMRGTAGGHDLLVATTHLESPLGNHDMRSSERKSQLKQAITWMQNEDGVSNCILAGDLNWNAQDGDPPLPARWQDAWSTLRPRDQGLTYDKATNQMLGTRPTKWGRRLDRILCKLSSLRLQRIEMVGRDPIPGAVRRKQERNRSISVLPVLPSDHYGLFLELAPTTSSA